MAARERGSGGGGDGGPARPFGDEAAALSDLAAGIAHDFNNLLTVIQANLREASGQATAGTAPLFRNAERAVESAADLSRRLMALGRARESARESVAVRAVLEELTGLLREQVDAGVRLHSEASADLRVVTSPSELQGYC